MRRGIAAATAGLGARTATNPVATEFGAVGFIAVTTDEVAVFAGEQGLLRPRITALVERHPRVEVREFLLERGQLLVTGTMSFMSGRRWYFEVPRARSKHLLAVERALTH